MKHKFQHSNRKINLPFSAVFMYLLLIAVLLSGVTFSKYVTGTSVGDSARVAYIKNITIEEEGNFTKPNEWTVIPGVDIQKRATVHFEGSEMACYVFLRIKTVGWTINNYSYVCKTGDTEALSWSVDKNIWNFLSEDTEGAVYYRIVSANDELHANVLSNDGEITVSDALTRTQLDSINNLSIELDAIAAQYYGFPENPAYNEQDRAKAVLELVKDK